MDVAALSDDLALECLEVEIEMRQGMFLDCDGGVAQILPFRQQRHHRGAARDKAGLQVVHRLLEIRIAQSGAGIGLEGVALRPHQPLPSPMAG